MKEQRTRMQQRAWALYRYANALECSDSTLVASMLQEAESDPVLERMIMDLNEVYQVEDRTVVHPDDVALAHEMLLDTLTEAGAAVQSEQKAAPSIPVVSLPEQKVARPVLARQLPRRTWYPLRKSWLVAAAAAVLIVLVLLPGTSTFATQFLQLFRVQQFQPVQSSSLQTPGQLQRDLTSFLYNIGDVNWRSLSNQQIISVLNSAQAEHQTHMHIQLPTAFPAGVGKVPRFVVTQSDQVTFTFNSTKAHDYLTKTGQSAIAIPTSLAGASFTIKLDPGVLISYYNSCQQAKDGKLQCTGGTPFSVSEIPAPQIQANGAASLSELRDFVLSLPKLSPDLHDILQHADEHTGTIPIPIPSQASSQQVTIKGTPGVLVTQDSIGGVIWQSQGVVYILLYGGNDSAQIQQSANSLQ